MAREDVMFLIGPKEMCTIEHELRLRTQDFEDSFPLYLFLSNVLNLL